MKICIKENEFNPSLLYQDWCTEEKAIQMGYKIVDIDDKYSDCAFDDFDEDFTFSVEKYQTRKQAEENKQLLPVKVKRLEELRKDIVQDIVGLYMEDIEARKEEYITLLNEVRVLQGKEPKPRKNIS